MRSSGGPGKRVAVLYTSVEESLKDVPEEKRADMDLAGNARSISEALTLAGHAPRTVTFGIDPVELARSLRSQETEAVFNLSECPQDNAQKEPHGAALLELLRIPYTGNGPFSLALCNNKALAKRILSSHGIPTPAYRLFSAPPRRVSGLSFPLIVKPALEDGSSGINEESVVEDEAGLRRQVARVVEIFKQEALVEEFVGGREFNVGVLGNGTAADPHRTLPPAELIYRNPRWRVCSFESKWDTGHPSYSEIASTCPADVSPSLRARLERWTLACAGLFALKGYARVDFRMYRKGKPFVLEVNPNPDLAPDAGLSKAARAAGTPYEALVSEILRLGLSLGAR